MEHEFGNVKENQARLHVDLRDLRNSLDNKFVWMVTTLIAFGAALPAPEGGDAEGASGR